MNKTFRLLGERLLVEQVKQKQGSIIVPQGAGNEMHRLGRIVAIGDGKRPGQKDIEIFLKVGDIVFFQTNAIMQSHMTYEVEKGKLLLNLLQGEIIAKIKTTAKEPEITLSNFETVGDWVLVRPYMKEASSTIILPENAQREQHAIYYKVEQLGQKVDLPIKVGEEICITHGRCQPINVSKNDLGYLHKNDVHGTVEDAVLA
jgi:co-chaperonin GroES (HSP10)